MGSRARFFESSLKLIPGVTIPLRSMLVESDEDSILISPVGTDEERAAVGRDLTTLVAPSLLHHLHLQHAADVMQPRDIWVPPGLTDKLPTLRSVRVFGLDAWPHHDQLDFAIVEGAPKRNEIVFFHRPSQTLYTADLFFHILEPEGALSPIALRALGVHKRFAMMKMWKRWVEDEAAFKRSMAEILAWDFERIVMAHGEIVATDARAMVEHALLERGLV
ncbi:MAG TPA: hypothetical protein VFQ53_06660 [Kofleriaceae bacterium]|nr:hypothetical protein [Kofleriaceae bacterium]